MASLAELGVVSKEARKRDTAAVAGGTVAGAAAGSVPGFLLEAAGRKAAGRHYRASGQALAAGDTRTAAARYRHGAKVARGGRIVGRSAGAAGAVTGALVGAHRSYSASRDRERLREVGKAFGVPAAPKPKMGFANLMKPKGVPKGTLKPVKPQQAPKPLTPPRVP